METMYKLTPSQATLISSMYPWVSEVIKYNHTDVSVELIMDAESKLTRIFNDDEYNEVDRDWLNILRGWYVDWKKSS